MTALTSSDGLLSKQPAIASPSSSLTRLLNRLQPTPETVVMILAVLIGGSTGMGVVTFHYLIDLIHSLMLEGLMGFISPWGAWTLACVPTLGGAIIGLMRWRWPDFGPGISSMIAAVQEPKRSVPLVLKPVTKMVAASVSLGTGASLGPEGPSVEIGANFGMLVSQALQVSQERQRLLLGAGAAAGIAAGFNAPIAGVFFALEVVLGTSFATSAVSVVLLAAVVAALIAQIGLGAQPAFALPDYLVLSPLELPLYMGLGLLASLVSIAYTQAVKLAQRCFQGEVPLFAWFSRIPRWLHPMIGGACVGWVALQWPQILGIGYETIEAMLQDVEFSLQLLLILLVLKLVMSAISLGSGLVGGTFAPTMFLGASLGSAYAKILVLAIPTIQSVMASPPAYAMVGMAAVLAGSARAPLTAILLLFELTRDYRIVLPLMAAVGLSVWLVDCLKPVKTSSSNLQEIGLNIEKDYKQEILQNILVSEAMNKSPLILSGTTTLIEAGLTLTDNNCHSSLVINEAGRLIGILTLRDVDRVLSRVKSDALMSYLAQQEIADICTTEILLAYEDEPVADALDRMAARGLHQLPVVERDNPYEALGLLNEEDISLVSQLAMTRDALRGYCSLPAASEAVGEEEAKVSV
ncbi:chloride channel protein [Microcoleus sp. FACHB-672]|uniref:chloride channel protein n=1 Tax=Microcoleus sp. FACHB-672 TaxID=2692825 RepID=UPI00168514BF|nr:chloride channel protein [Microcoleus sp. FACHB-672]MBD2039519.1 chloride channel protein [Microcoleus sp. FACHB-672]